ncbi:META domain-containing protein [Brachyspira pilosicoli]|uniref:META domain-containing protein n=1 Tax=Brachyspira pilosicoli TaxID=52584 RepID=UPI0030068D8D
MVFVQEDSKKIEKIKVYKLVNMYSYMNITISIDKNKIYGQSSVNDYWADCKIENDKISISMINTTRKTADAKRRNAEGEYLSILQAAYSFNITDNILTIYTTFRDEPLIYEEIK